MLPRLIATDLDGTLLDPSGIVTPRTVVALRRAADAGITVVFATGRPPIVAGREIEAVGHGVHYGVMANGTVVCSLPDGAVLRAHTFAAATARDAVLRLRAHDRRFGVALATDRGFTAEPGFHQRMPIAPHADDAVADALVGHEHATDTIKLFAFHPEHGAHELMAMLPPVLGEHLVVNHMGADAVEIAPAGADKGAGLRWLCEHLDVDTTDVLVFGDEVNDLPMFEVAGRRVAMANAHPEVRAAADEVTASNADDGVALVIERLLG